MPEEKGIFDGILAGIKGSLSKVVLDVVVMVLGGQISNDALRAEGVKHGKWLTANAKDKLGNSWEGIEGLMQEKAAFYFDGVHAGLDSDD